MLVVHPTSRCDVCLEPYNISQPGNSPHGIPCGHIFCLSCLRNLSSSVCPLCRKAFQLDRVKKLHVARPAELDGVSAAGTTNAHAQAFLLLQRVALLSRKKVSDDDIVKIITEVEVWLSSQPRDDDSTRLLRAAVNILVKHKTSQDQHKRERAEHRRLRGELERLRRDANHDPETSRAVEESFRTRVSEIEMDYVLELSRLQAEIDSLRSRSPNTTPSLSTSHQLRSFDRFPALAGLSGSASAPLPMMQPSTVLPGGCAIPQNGNASSMNRRPLATTIYTAASDIQHTYIPFASQQPATPRLEITRETMDIVPNELPLQQLPASFPSRGSGPFGSDGYVFPPVETYLTLVAGSGHHAGFIDNERIPYAPSYRGSDQSIQTHGFSTQRPLGEVVSGPGQMRVPRRTTIGTVSTTDKDVVATNISRRLLELQEQGSVNWDHRKQDIARAAGAVAFSISHGR